MTLDVEYFTCSSPLAYSRFGRIHVSTALRRQLTSAQLTAVVYHELGHITGSHVTIKVAFNSLCIAAILACSWFEFAAPYLRLALCLMAIPTWYWARCRLNHWAEFDADDYAGRHGYGEALAMALSRLAPDDTGTWEHPSTASRIGRIYAKG